MRPLKFRIWDKTYKEFINKDNLCRAYCNKDSVLCFDFIEGFKVEGYIVQQFTGLFDKKGVGIYEGDVIRRYSGEAYQADYEVYWKDGGFSLISAARDGDDFGVFTANLDFPPSNQSIVIGNICERQKLLK